MENSQTASQPIRFDLNEDIAPESFVPLAKAAGMKIIFVEDPHDDDESKIYFVPDLEAAGTIMKVAGNDHPAIGRAFYSPAENVGVLVNERYLQALLDAVSKLEDQQIAALGNKVGFSIFR